MSLRTIREPQREFDGEYSPIQQPKEPQREFVSTLENSIHIEVTSITKIP